MHSRTPSEKLDALVESTYEQRTEQLDKLQAQHDVVMAAIARFKEMIIEAEYVSQDDRDEALLSVSNLADDYDNGIKDGPLCCARQAADPRLIEEHQQWSV